MIQPGFGFEWDEDKDLANVAKHGINFQAATAVFDEAFQQFEDKRRDYGEARIKIVGVLEHQIVAVICTQRGNSVRIISARRARRDERRDYYRAYPR